CTGVHLVPAEKVCAGFSSCQFVEYLLCSLKGPTSRFRLKQDKHMKPVILFWIFGVAMCLSLSAATVTVSVPGRANPYLAGLPDGTLANPVTAPPTRPDRAPEQSPVQ